MRYLLLLVNLIFCHHLTAQLLDEKNFTLYTKLDGLSQNYVNAIAQDSTGYIWIATNKGLNRFDGTSFINFFKTSENSPLPNNAIGSLRVQNNNEIIGATIGGAFSFNVISGHFKKFIVPADSITFFWTNRMVDAMKDFKNNFVVSTRTGLYVFDPSGKIICRYDHHVSADAGRVELWFGNWLQPIGDNKIFQQNGLSGSLYDPASNRIDTFFTLHKLKQQGYRAYLKGGDTSSSFRGLKDEVLFVNPIQNTIDIISLTGNSVLCSPISKNVIADLNWQSKLFFISDSTIAITSKIGGFYIFHFNAEDKRITGNEKKYFASKYCSSIFKDRDGRLWIGTNDGLYRQNLRNPFFTTDDISHQLPDIVNTGIQSIYIEGDKLFLGLRNEGGLLLLDKYTKKIYSQVSFAKLGSGSNSIVYIFSYHPDTLWLGTGNSIIWLNKKNFTYGKLLDIPGQPDWMTNDRCRNYLEDSKGNIWFSFGRLNSVVMFDRNQYTFREIVSPLLRITFCFSMIEDKQGNIWMAGDGLCRWNVKKKIVDTLIPYPPVRKSQYNFIELLEVDADNNLWFSSAENEIIQYNDSENRMWLRLPQNNILDGYLVTNSPIINDHIWMCLANGMSAFNIKDHSVKQFNYADGLPSAVATSVRRGSFYDRRENRFYFSAGQYLISFIPDVSKPHVQSIPNFFPELIVSTGKVLSPAPDKINLPYSQNNIQLRFNVINFTDPEDNRFAYRMMKDADSTWHDLNTQTTIGLNNLAIGSYHIQVKLSSVNNRWPEQVKEIRLTIVPPFWKTIWFISGVALVMVVAMTFLYRYRIRQINQRANLDRLLAQTELKALHTQMNPHFIFNCLNSIKTMILANENNKASRYLSKFAQLIRITLNHSSRPFISLKNTIDYLQRYLEMEQIRTNRFTYDIKVSDDLNQEDTYIPPMLIQPFIENSIWHGELPEDELMQINISFTGKENELICKVEDNGIGIEASLKKKEDRLNHHSLGIANIRQRMELLNEKYNLHSTLTIEDKSVSCNSIGTGTIATLRLPIKNTDT